MTYGSITREHTIWCVCSAHYTISEKRMSQAIRHFRAGGWKKIKDKWTCAKCQAQRKAAPHA